ncbi:beta-klotho [Xyrichtys novacula]|uniref:Beta-klotho n=1 Tax=Xyrichtys novacula TaxID=13765 RepID=A0AAV1FCN5_XYRNO|nr:beta-klotho [Xyrichtys novacula]
MLDHPSLPPQLLSLCLLFLVCSVNKGACSPGEGRRIWQQPKPDLFIKDQALLHDNFPSGFLWGTGTSAFQTEGAWDQEGKGASIWDHFTHSSAGSDLENKTANVASDSYMRWEEDVEALEYLGVKSYFFSLSWPRIFPDGVAKNQPNAAAVEHYSRLIEKLHEKNIEPVVTLYHWDLPQALQERYGGWRNDTLVELFEEYAAFCFHKFGSRVKLWFTMHNPYLVAVQGYGTGVHAPGETGGPAVPLIVAHNLIRAHAKAWHTYNNYYRPTQKGQVSIVLGSHWVEPQRGEAMGDNVEFCQQSMEAVLGWFANPIFGDGDYPVSLKTKHGALMPSFSTEEKLWVQNTADFFALSFGPNNFRLGRGLERNGQTVFPDLRRVLGWIKLEYGDPWVIVAEGGWFSEASVGREDTVAIYWMKRFIYQVLQAIKLDGVKVSGYSTWSLVDGFEWNYGFNVRRGLFNIDFCQQNRTRIPKTSAQYYKQVITDNGFPRDETSREIRGSFPCDFHWGIADSTLQVQFYPFSPQFTDPHLYTWNLTGDNSLHPVSGVTMQTRPAQCTDYLAIHNHLRLLKSTGASHFCIALNWSLILPQGDLSNVNVEALRYYRCVLTELKRMDINAVVILYYPTHRAPNQGLPEPLYASGGWLNYSTVEAFQEYAALCYQQLGSWVPYWITINDPNRLVDVYSSEKEKHQAVHHLILAHAKAWRLHEREYSSQQSAKVSLALHADWAEPANPFLDSHSAAAQRFLLFELGRFLDPLLGTKYEKEHDKGDYPQEMKAHLEERARVTGIPGSPLPNFTKTERKEIRGTLSFIALNHFTTRLVSPYPPTHSKLKHKQPPDHGCLILTDPTWTSSGLGQALVPWGLRKILNWVSQRYGEALPILVTASGVDDQAVVEDKLRQHFLRSYLQEALKAHNFDRVNLQGFYMWKLQDRQVPQFGLFTSSQHNSKAKASMTVYREIITHGGFPKDNTTQTCRPSKLQEPCSACVWMSENKALLVFGGCLLITAVMFVALLIFVIITKRNQTRERGMKKVNRRNEGFTVCPCPPVKYKL